MLHSKYHFIAMLRITKRTGLPAGRQGFTLIELIVAIAIFGALSLVSVQSLWDTLSTRSKQYSIENSASAIRPIVAILTQAITSATSINIQSATQIQITGTSCMTVQLNTSSKALEMASVTAASCTPPSSGFSALTPPTVTITAFTLSPVGATPKVISIFIAGLFKDSIGSHAFQYNFSVSPRVAL